MYCCLITLYCYINNLSIGAYKHTAEISTHSAYCILFDILIFIKVYDSCILTTQMMNIDNKHILNRLQILLRDRVCRFKNLWNCVVILIFSKICWEYSSLDISCRYQTQTFRAHAAKEGRWVYVSIWVVGGINGNDQSVYNYSFTERYRLFVKRSYMTFYGT